jgi:sigma-E factor negative regulatory protein RseA
MTSMNEKQAEQLSAMLDGELGLQAVNRTVSDVLAGDDEALARYGRYRLIGDVLRGESSVLAQDVARRVRVQLEDEPTVLAPVLRRPPRWVRPAAGLAIAASVAAAAVMIAPGLLSTQGGPGPQPVVSDSAVNRAPAGAVVLVAGSESMPAPVSRAVEPEHWRALNSDYAERLNRLVLEHQEFGGRSGINGPVAHLGLVSYDGR